MTTTTCPECLSPNVGPMDPDNTVDCHDCGIYWDVYHPNNQRDSHAFGQHLLDGPPPLLACAVCEQDADTYPPIVIARWNNEAICTDCLEHRPGKEEAEAEALGKQQPVTQEEYREDGGGYCVYCRHGNFDVIRSGGSGGSLYERCRCGDCRGEFTLVYRLGGFVREDGVHEAEDEDAIMYVDAIDTLKQ